MMEEILGLNETAETLTGPQMSARAVVVLLYGIVLLRVGSRRGLGALAGFDVLLTVILGSVLSRAINGQSALLPTLGAATVIVLVHWMIGAVASRVDWVSNLVKGPPVVLIRHGVVDHAAARRCQLSPEDLEANLRLHGCTCDPTLVAEARLERNGQVSVVKKPD